MAKTFCPYCLSYNVTTKKRGYSWCYACIGFIFLRVIGLLLGFIGKDKLVHHCLSCGKTWTE